MLVRNTINMMSIYFVKHQEAINYWDELNYQKDHMKITLDINFVKQAFHSTNYLLIHYKGFTFTILVSTLGYK